MAELYPPDNMTLPFFKAAANSVADFAAEHGLNESSDIDPVVMEELRLILLGLQAECRYIGSEMRFDAANHMTSYDLDVEVGEFSVVSAVITGCLLGFKVTPFIRRGNTGEDFGLATVSYGMTGPADSDEPLRPTQVITPLDGFSVVTHDVADFAVN